MLDEVMQYMKERHGFISGYDSIPKPKLHGLLTFLRERQYKNKLKEWGFEKNIKVPIMRLMLAKAEKRKYEEDKETRFRYKGRDILPSRMDHFSKRKFVKNGKRVSPNACECPTLG